MQLSACRIQGAVRRYQAIQLATALLKVREEREARIVVVNISCRVIQRVARGMLGRKKVQEKIDYWKVSNIFDILYIYLCQFYCHS